MLLFSPKALGELLDLIAENLVIQQEKTTKKNPKKTQTKTKTNPDNFSKVHFTVQKLSTMPLTKIQGKKSGPWVPASIAVCLTIQHNLSPSV